MTHFPLYVKTVAAADKGKIEAPKCYWKLVLENV